MVTRKSVPSVATAPAPAAVQSPPAQAPPNPPYPTSPLAPAAKDQDANAVGTRGVDTSRTSDFEIIDKEDAQSRPRSDSDASHGTWDDSDDEDEAPNQADIPQPLRIAPSKQNLKEQDENKPREKEELPAVLRPGPVNLANGASARNPVTPPLPTGEIQSNPWANTATKPVLSQQPVNSHLESNNPFRQQHVPEPQSSQAAWEETRIPVPSGPPPAPPVELPAVQTPADELSRLSLGSPPFHTAEVLHVPQQNQTSGQALPPSNPWQNESSSQPQPPPKDPLTPIEPHYPPPPSGPPPTGALIDHEEQTPRPESISISIPPQQPSSAVPESPRTIAHKQRNEHYQIKHINWKDATSSEPGLRRSPILTQNANGPCPLLALVNALVLSTPPQLNTALIETLQTREQVSLGLLLDAVFDELMSGRRGDTAQRLPDVGELYSFLLALHTGMNVNPRFILPQEPHGSRPETTYSRFEETREMRLYSTFNIPLLHGWTIPNGSSTYEAFQRSAPTFEDAQNIQFAEMELEDKLRAEGLSGQEQQTLQDVQTIKAFLNTWPTQLTDSGLTSVAESLAPGQVAILFRNDHFSTIYKERRHGVVMTLVTDAGYSSHDEIVWESLVDVNGAASQMYSGDFRVVSHNQDSGRVPNVPGESRMEHANGVHHQQMPGTWEASPRPADMPTAPGARPTSPFTATATDLGLPQDAQLSAREQEDHDLALALQLQEEEEEQQRQEQERRRREQELSEQFLETEGERPPIPPRRNQAGRGGRNSSGTPNTRPPMSRTADADPDAPPTYEQAASDRPYRPAGATAPATQGNPLNAYDQLRRQQNANLQGQVNMNSSVRPGRGGRRRSSLLAAQQQQQQQQQQHSVQYAPHPGAYPGRVQGGANLKDADERCALM